ncbi:MFS transporter [Pseudodesulfovibrio sp.]|nr:MFS transporter [Pseudodesulfovibrio sp.]
MPQERGHVASYAWVVLLAIFIASVAAPINQFKVPPVMPALIGQFGLDMTMAGLLMSLFSFAGLVVAFPAGALLSRVGQKNTCIIALLAIMAGSLWGTFSGSTFVLLTSRTLEGAGMAILGVTAPVVIAGWFPPDRRGLPMGIWSAWVSTGVIIMMNVSPMVTPGGQWTQTWWLGTGIVFVALLVFGVLHRNPESGESDGDVGHPPMTQMFREVLAMRDVWFISITLFSFNIMVLAMNTFFPTYLSKVVGLPMAEADFYSSLPNLVMLVSCPLGGLLADKVGSRKRIFSICMALLGVWWIVALRAPASAIPWVMVVFGLLGGPVITTIITALPAAVKRPALIGFGMSLLMFWHHLGEFAGPIYFGKILDMTSNWTTAAAFMVPICLIGGVAGWMVRE